MTKKVTRTTEEEILDGTEPSEDRLDDDVIRALTELEGADDIRWQVHRVSQPNPGFCPPELTTAELTMHRISEFGPGRYRVKGLRPNGQYYKSAMVTIAAPVKSSTSEFETVLASLKKGEGDGDRTLLLAMMNQNTQILTAALSRQHPQSNFPWSAIITASPLLITALKDFVIKPDSDEKSMEKILKLVTVMEKLRGDGKETSSNWADIIRDALPSLSAMVTRPIPPQPVAVRVMPQRQADVSSQETIATPEAVQPTVENMSFDWLQRKLEELLQNAADNKNPELRAEVFIDDLPKFIPESYFVQLLSTDDWFEKLSTFEPRVIHYKGWFEEFHECLLEQFESTEHIKGANSDDQQSAE